MGEGRGGVGGRPGEMEHEIDITIHPKGYAVFRPVLRVRHR